MPDSSTADVVVINGWPYALVTEKGMRGIKRSQRATNVSDPARIRLVQWGLWGPIGASRESVAQYLGVNYVQNLETRWPRRLISAGLRTAVTLTGYDPAGATGTGLFGGFLFGASTVKFGGSISASDVVCFDEQSGYLFVHRGRVSTQVSLSTMLAVGAATHGSAVRWAQNWRGYGWLACGPVTPMQQRLGVTTTGATYADTQDQSSALIYANYLAVGSDRCWVVKGDPTGATNNLVSFTLDAFQNLASDFPVGDPKVGLTGIGPFGPFTHFGSQAMVLGVTDQGKPVPLSRALIGHLSPQNGQQWADPGWGWNYYIADTGLRATNGYADNPVGIGEALRGFTGHGGVPTALWAERGELFIAYADDTGNAWLYRCVFGEGTASTGQPNMYPFHYLASAVTNAGFSSNTPANPVVVWGEGTNMGYEVISRDGRDDLFPDRLYSTSGGTWYGTMLDRDPNLLKTLRLVRVYTKGLISGSSWAVACSFDEGDYVTIGTATANGANTLRPVSAGVPLTDITGATIAPRLTQVATGTLTNYITNPGFQDGTSGWSFGSGGGVASATDTPEGTDSCTITGGTGSGFTIAAQIPITLVAGTTYTARISVYVPTGGVTALTPSITGLSDATGDLSSPANVSLRDQWQEVEIGPFTTGSDVSGIFNCSPSATGLSTLSFGAVMIVNSATQVDYFDGSFGTGYAWTGTEYRSTSTFTTGTYTPPEIDGMLEIEYDERPTFIEEVEVVINIEGTGSDMNATMQRLNALVGSNTNGPTEVSIPDDLPPVGSVNKRYAMISEVKERQDLSADGIQAVTVKMQMWDVA